ncbi:MAG TPA: ABC transporter permease, partial [Candidatus Acidoferrum sp.]|nr:ABC transporter permease [Candidatus Acidoferrum sp.]
ANTAIFTVVNGVLLRSVPGVQRANEIVTLKRLQKNNPDYSFGYPDYRDYRDQNRSFAGLAGRCRTRLTLNHGATELIVGELVTGNYFSVLGVNPEIGRVIVPSDVETDGESAVAVLSHALWERAFGSDPGIVGKSIQLNGHAFTVVGVATKQFTGSELGSPTDVWVPLTMQPAAIPRMSSGVLESREAGWVGIFGRLKTGVPLIAARSELQTIAARLAAAYPRSNEHRSVDVVRSFGMDPDDRVTLERFFAMLLASVGLLLLIACSNVANLLLSRSEVRRREIAMRLALGASRSRLVRQLLTEGMLLAAIAGGLGLLLAPWTASLMLAFRQPLYALQNVVTTPDVRVLGFTILATALTGVLFGLAPALQSSKPDLVVTLKENTPGAGRRSRLRGALVVSQMAITLILLVTAGVVVRKMRVVLNQDPGFRTTNLLMMSVSPSIQGYSEARGELFYSEVLRRVDEIPGVQSASLATTVPPIDFSGRISIFYEGQAPPREYFAGHEFELGIRVDVDNVAPRYLETMGIPLLEGRDFSERDTKTSPLVAIVSQRLAKHLWADGRAIGRRIEWPSLQGPARPAIEIIGIAADARYRSLLSDAPLLLYLPVFQNYSASDNLVIHTIGDPANVLPDVHRAVASIDASLPIFREKSISDEIADSLWQQRMASGLLGSFSMLALLLAGIGLYAVVAHWTSRRTQEIGIRMALGANPRDVLLLVVGHGARLAAAGVVAGLAISIEVTRVVSEMLYGTRSVDMPAMTGISGLLAAVAMLACYIPARRAMRVDPMVALRHE